MDTKIIIFVLLLLPLASAGELILDSPASIVVDSPFNVSISYTDNRDYDVKIFIHTSSDSKISRDEVISSIMNEGVWKDSYYYVQDAYPSSRIFSIQVDSNPESSAEICSQIRQPGRTSTEAKVCNSISIRSPSNISSASKNLPDHTGERDNLNTFIPDNQPIRLSNQQSKVFLSRDTLNIRIISYSFTTFAIIILVLLLMRKL